MDPLSILGLAHLLRRAYDLLNNCKGAHEEIHLAADHVHGLAIVLEGVKSDLAENPRSFLHQTSADAQARKTKLQTLLRNCGNALARMEGLVKKYHMYRNGHVSMWDTFRWSAHGKKEIADCKVDVILSSCMLDMFLSKLGVSAMWTLESNMEAMRAQQEAMGR
jgi:hypothetical protein